MSLSALNSLVTATASPGKGGREEARPHFSLKSFPQQLSVALSAPEEYAASSLRQRQQLIPQKTVLNKLNIRLIKQITT